LDTGFKRTNVVDWLEANDVPYQVHLHARVYNALEASAIGLPFDVSLLLKTLVFKAADPSWLLVAVRAVDQTDYGALAKISGFPRRALRFADAADLRKYFGWEPGGASPIPIIAEAAVIVDTAVLEMPVIYFGGGRPDITIEALPQNLFGKIACKVSSITKSQ
jgi:prolyl-tRNA editing enzyme YbaK/EbsC (Cys-tRNA(Pro) deacylase)